MLSDVLPLLELPLVIVEHLRNDAEQGILKLRSSDDEEEEGDNSAQDSGSDDDDDEKKWIMVRRSLRQLE